VSDDECSTLLKKAFLIKKSGQKKDDNESKSAPNSIVDKEVYDVL
jgi:hypothetical protein